MSYIYIYGIYIYTYTNWKSWGRQCEHVTCSKACFFSSFWVAVRGVICPTPPGPVLPTRNSSECRCAESFASGSQGISGCPQGVLREFPEPSESREWDSALSWGCLMFLMIKKFWCFQKFKICMVTLPGHTIGIPGPKIAIWFRTRNQSICG